MLNFRISLLGAIAPLLLVASPLLAEDQATDKKENNVFTLGEIVVTADKPASTLSTTVNEISAQDITATGASTVAEALEQIPGVDIQRSGKGQMFVSIRGFDQDDTKVLIDGVPAHESYFGTVDLSMLPTESISKITVTKGAVSALYGADTMGGIINIITKKGGNTPAGGDATISFGNDGAANYIANFGGTSGRLNYSLTYGYRTSNGVRLSKDFNPHDPNVGIGSSYNEDGGLRDLSDYIKKSLNAKVGYDPDQDTSMYLSFDYHNDERGVPTETNRYWYFTKWNQWQLNLVGEHKFNDVISAKARVFYLKHDDSLTDVSWDANHTTTPKKKWFQKSYYDDYSEGAELQSSFDLGKWSLIRAGFNYLKDNNIQGNYYDSIAAAANKGQIGWQREQEYTADTYTMAVEDEINPVKDLSVVVGASYNTFKPVKADLQPVPDTMATLNPQLGVVYMLSSKTTLHASIGKETRFPHLKELYSQLAGGNPNLNPQKAISYELGATQKFNNTFEGSISLFQSDIRDLITYVTLQSKDKIYVNIGKANIKGIETDLNANITESLQAGLNYTYMSTEDDSNGGRELSGKPKHKLNLDIRYLFSFGLASTVQASYTGGEYWSDFSNTWAELPGFTVVNVRLSQDLGKLLLKNSEVFLQVNNVADKYYYETDGPEAGRSFLTGLTLKF
jgi:outer membrane receptor for ferrienterochelin and colicins